MSELARAAVLGATGGIGSALTVELVRRGWRVRAVSRAGALPAGVPAGDVDVVAADISVPSLMSAAAADCDFVFHAAAPAYHRWVQEFPAMNESVIAGTAAAGARLIVADNLYMYGPMSHPMAETSPAAATSKKGRLRVELAQRLLDAHADGMVPVALGRISDYYGPNGISSNGGERVFATAIAGKTVRMLGKLDQPHSWSYLPDVARALVDLSGQQTAYGRAWHLPVEPPLTAGQFLRAVFDAAGQPYRAATVAPALVRMLGIFNPMMRELPEVLYQFDSPFIVDDQAYRQAFPGFRTTPHEQAIRATVDWFRSRAGQAA